MEHLWTVLAVIGLGLLLWGQCPALSFTPLVVVGEYITADAQLWPHQLRLLSNPVWRFNWTGLASALIGLLWIALFSLCVSILLIVGARAETFVLERDVPPGARLTYTVGGVVQQTMEVPPGHVRVRIELSGAGGWGKTRRPRIGR